MDRRERLNRLLLVGATDKAAAGISLATIFQASTFAGTFLAIFMCPLAKMKTDINIAISLTHKNRTT